MPKRIGPWRGWLYKKIDHWRGWLENNKIFFETIGFISISIMAVLVSFGSGLIISDQVHWMELENQPEFIFNIENSPINYTSTDLISGNSKVINYSRPDLVITNLKEPYINLSLEYVIFGSFLYGTENEKGRVSSYITIPIDRMIYDYVGVDSQGKAHVPLSMDDSSKNSEVFNKIMTLFNRYIVENGDFLSDVVLSKYFKITYQDINGKNHSKYYIANSDDNFVQISKEVYENKLNEYVFPELSDTDFPLVYLIQHLGVGNQSDVQSDLYNSNLYLRYNQVFEPWYQAIKKRFYENH